jgi:hypothetical protein
MTNEITLAKVELKLDLEVAGLKVLDYVPERIVPPIVIMNARSPYLAVSDLSNEYYLNVDLVLIAATATNKQSTEKLDELLEAVVKALPAYARMLPTGAPYNLQTNNAEYLAVNVPLELEITI